MGPDGLVPQFGKGGVKGKPGGGSNFVFVDVVLTGWMETDPLNQENQMELARKPGIMKIRANNEKAGTLFLHFAINMKNTLAASLANFDDNCEWSGKVEQTPRNEAFAIQSILPLLDDGPAVKERSVLVVIDESAFVETSSGSGVFVSESEDNGMGISPGFFVRGAVRGAPTVTVVGDPTGDDFTATFSGGTVELAGSPSWEQKEIHLSCNISDDITFTVMPQTS